MTKPTGKPKGRPKKVPIVQEVSEEADYIKKTLDRLEALYDEADKVSDKLSIIKEMNTLRNLYKEAQKTLSTDDNRVNIKIVKSNFKRTLED